MKRNSINFYSYKLIFRVNKRVPRRNIFHLLLLISQWIIYSGGLIRFPKSFYQTFTYLTYYQHPYLKNKYKLKKTNNYIIGYLYKKYKYSKSIYWRYINQNILWLRSRTKYLRFRNLRSSYLNNILLNYSYLKNNNIKNLRLLKIFKSFAFNYKTKKDCYDKNVKTINHNIKKLNVTGFLQKYVQLASKKNNLKNKGRQIKLQNRRKFYRIKIPGKGFYFKLKPIKRIKLIISAKNKLTKQQYYIFYIKTNNTNLLTILHNLHIRKLINNYICIKIKESY